MLFFFRHFDDERFTSIDYRFSLPLYAAISMRRALLIISLLFADKRHAAMLPRD